MERRENDKIIIEGIGEIKGELKGVNTRLDIGNHKLAKHEKEIGNLKLYNAESTGYRKIATGLVMLILVSGIWNWWVSSSTTKKQQQNLSGFKKELNEEMKASIAPLLEVQIRSKFEELSQDFGFEVNYINE